MTDTLRVQFGRSGRHEIERGLRRSREESARD